MPRIIPHKLKTSKKKSSFWEKRPRMADVLLSTILVDAGIALYSRHYPYGIPMQPKHFPGRNPTKFSQAFSDP